MAFESAAASLSGGAAVPIRPTDVRAQLPQIASNEYFLVRYRDFSAWACSHHRSIAKKFQGVSNNAPQAAQSRWTSWLGASTWYVDQFFAIRVGATPGAFIPITEAQFRYGWEKLLEVHMTNFGGIPASMPEGAFPIPSLNEDQFQALQSVRPSGSLSSGATAAASAGPGDYVAPSPWDWTPSAVQKRWNHFLDQQYRFMGRLVFRGIVIGGTVYLALYFIRRGLGASHNNNDRSSSNRSNCSDGRRNRTRSGGSGRNDDWRDDVQHGRGLMSLMSLSLRDMFDFMLAPRSER